MALQRYAFSYLLRGAGELRAGAGARVLVELEARAPVQAAAEAVVPARACGKRRICFLSFSSLFVPSLSWQEMGGFHEKERGKARCKTASIHRTAAGVRRVAAALDDVDLT